MRISWILRDDSLSWHDYEHLVHAYVERSLNIATGGTYVNISNPGGTYVTHHDTGVIEARTPSPGGDMHIAVWATGDYAYAVVTADSEAFHVALHDLFKEASRDYCAREDSAPVDAGDTAPDGPDTTGPDDLDDPELYNLSPPF
jgi:hypothetical protein